MLGDRADSSSFAMVTFVGLSFLNSAQSLDVCNITFLVDSHVCGQRNTSMFSKRPREQKVGTSPLSLCVVILANYWKMAFLAEKKLSASVFMSSIVPSTYQMLSKCWIKMTKTKEARISMGAKESGYLRKDCGMY